LRIFEQRIGLEIERYRLEKQRRTAMIALEASEQRNRLILEAAGDGTVTLDADARIEIFNPAAARIFGYREEQAGGKNASFLFSGSGSGIVLNDSIQEPENLL
jgi:PAS domain-containing protein